MYCKGNRLEPNPRMKTLDDHALSLYRSLSRLRNFLRDPQLLVDHPPNLVLDLYSLNRVVSGFNDECARALDSTLPREARRIMKGGQFNA